MRAVMLDEPHLEFAGGLRHVDPRFGVAEFGPADLAAPGSPREIKVGVIGTKAAIDEVEQWLTSCREPIEAKSADRPGLWPAWPGLRADAGYRAEIVFDPRLQRPIKGTALLRLEGRRGRARVEAAVELFVDELQGLVEDGRPDVVICVIPDPVLDAEAAGPGHHEQPDVVDGETAESDRAPAFHDLLKARAMPFRVPLQLLKPSTYDASRARAQARRSWRRRQREDDATVAWNFSSALYYKAGGTPWRLVRAPTDLEACYVGVAFFQTADGRGTATSVAQVYNQRGDGVIVRGAPAYRSARDRQLHLTEPDAGAVLADALKAYRREHRHAPARIVVHKTSPFDDGEVDGMLAAAEEADLDLCELVWVTGSDLRLFRRGELPPLRGTMVELADDEIVLYSRGSVEWYETYAGMYVPRPIALRAAHVERSPREVAEELLALTKMNWNSTRFDGREPVTLRTARRVSDIIKHLPPDAPIVPTYAYYM